jgi:hypothetical protein
VTVLGFRISVCTCLRPSASSGGGEEPPESSQDVEIVAEPGAPNVYLDAGSGVMLRES